MSSAGPKEIPRSGQDAAAIFRPLRMAIFAREPTPIKTGSAVFHGGALPPLGPFRTPETPRRRGRRRYRDNRAFRLTADSTPQVAIFRPDTALRARIRLRNPTKKSSARETRRAVPFQHCRNMPILLGIRPRDIHVAKGDLNVATGTSVSGPGLPLPMRLVDSPASFPRFGSFASFPRFAWECIPGRFASDLYENNAPSFRSRGPEVRKCRRETACL